MQYRTFTRRTKKKPRALAPARIWTSFALSIVLVGLIVGLAALWPSRPGQAGSSIHQRSREVDDKTELISSWHDEWFNMPGTKAGDEGLRVQAVPFAIVEQDGSDGQANLPVNLYGAHLRISGDFGVRATLEDVTGKASISLYGQTPVIFDEFRYERAALQLTFDRDKLFIQTWEDNKAAPVREFTLPDADTTKKLEIVRQDGLVSFSVNGTRLGDIPEGQLFANREVWFGMGAEGSDWLLSSLRAERRGHADLEIVDTSTLNFWQSRSSHNAGLQQLAKEKRHDFTIGAAVALGPLVSDREYARVALGGNFGSFTTENALKWQFVHPAPDTYDFHEADAIVDIARRHDIKIHGHTLVFGEANPAWVRQLPLGTAEDKQNVEKIMLEHISRVAGRYKDEITSWDVVNEPLADYDNFELGTRELREHIWYRAMGEDYIAKAFHAAHDANPSAMLFINEYGLEEDGERWTAFYNLVKRLKEQGVPIDGVGFQAHVYEPADRISSRVLREHIRALDELGLKSRISEMDVYIEDGQAAQARQYSSVLRTCLQEPGCVSFTTWGVSDRYDMFRDDDGSIQFGQDFLWDHNMQPTPAVDAMRRTLE